MAAQLKVIGSTVETPKLQNSGTDRQKALEAALAQIDRAFGKGSAMKLGSREKMEVETISTGSLGLDIALGVGGLPRGRVIEIYGPESSGKTTLALHVIAEAQRNGGTAAFVDAEHALDPGYAKKLGVDIDELIVSQPDTGEQALEIVDTLVRSNAIDVLVVDSVAALVPRAEIEGEMGDSHVGLQARLMSQSLRKLTGSISRSRCMVIFINQLRMKIGVMYGNPETTTGGNALKFYASVRLDIRRTGQIKDRDDIVGNTTRVKVVKNKVAPPFKQVEFDIMYGQGVSKVGEILDLGVKAGLVEKSGAWFSYDSIRIGQGRENAKAYLKENPDVAQRIENAIRGKTEEVGEALMVGAGEDELAAEKLLPTPSPLRGEGWGEGDRHSRFRQDPPESRSISRRLPAPSARPGLRRRAASARSA
jgi:recombination protein RecA